MKWFDKNEIKNQEKLTSGEIAYLLRPSISVLGFTNVFIRMHFDLLVARILLYIGDQLVALLPDFTLALIFFGLIVIAESSVTYFFVRHNRRLAWNRNKWGSFETFKKSESRWKYFAIITLIYNFVVTLRPALQSEEPMWFILYVPVVAMSVAIILPFLRKPRILVQTTQTSS